MTVLGVLTLSLLLAVASVASVASDHLHESCNRTRYPAFCLRHLRPQPGSRTQLYPASLSLETTRRMGNSTVRFANNFIENFLASADRNRSNDDYRVLDCVSDCAFALNISVVRVKYASAVLDTDRKKARVLVRWAVGDVRAAICAEKDQNRSTALKFIANRNKVYRKLLRITIDLINLLKK
uniref:Pectinesterase inhibitor domain-containing protein n=1 Tax=Ananas comosus var. bracteatus TaxID=296719 RepID=A0A6V7NEH9_ANACO|nr:unnamed protein product [Ananas comosus var. bracteatus]